MEESRRPVALVSGGAIRVGRAISLELHRAGYAVAVAYNTSRQPAESLVAEIEADDGRALAVSADLTVPEEVRQLVGRVVDELGGIDLLVNNAAVFERRPFLDVDDDLWSRTLETNLTGAFRLSRLVARAMMSAGGGRIVNICGNAGIHPVGDYAAYCVSKAGLDTLTRCMAEALAPKIQVNGVAPGTVLFPEGTADQVKGEVIERIPAGRTGAPEDVAAVVRLLAEAPDYVTGAIVTVDGGASLHG